MTYFEEEAHLLSHLEWRPLSMEKAQHLAVALHGAALSFTKGLVNDLAEKRIVVQPVVLGLVQTEL